MCVREAGLRQDLPLSFCTALKASRIGECFRLYLSVLPEPGLPLSVLTSVVAESTIPATFLSRNSLAIIPSQRSSRTRNPFWKHCLTVSSASHFPAVLVFWVIRAGAASQYCKQLATQE